MVELRFSVCEYIVRSIPQFAPYRMVLLKSLHSILIHLSFIDEVDSIYEKRRFQRVNIRGVGRLARDCAAGKIINNLMVVNSR